jgi:hypothetical protein
VNIEKQEEAYAFIPLNVAYDEKESRNKNHWVALIVDKKYGLVLYLDPARKTLQHLSVNKLKESLNYKENIILNPIDFQISEKQEGSIRHCGAYVVELFKIFADSIRAGKCISGASRSNPKISNSVSVMAVFSSIGCGEAEEISRIRQAQVQDAYKIINANLLVTPQPPTKLDSAETTVVVLSKSITSVLNNKPQQPKAKSTESEVSQARIKDFSSSSSS